MDANEVIEQQRKHEINAEINARRSVYPKLPPDRLRRTKRQNGPKTKEITGTCVMCGAKFETDRVNQKCCSAACLYLKDNGIKFRGAWLLRKHVVGILAKEGRCYTEIAGVVGYSGVGNVKQAIKQLQREQGAGK
jgi:hypothetical protein